jgi:hypothetical protein
MKFKRRFSARDLRKTGYAPGEITIERLPSGNLDAYETPNVKPHPPRPEHLICDCCLIKTDRLWIWTHYGFCVRTADSSRYQYLKGAWAFCVFCRPLFEARQSRILAARVKTLNPELDEDAMTKAYEVLGECVYGDCRTWEANQPYSNVFPGLDR